MKEESSEKCTPDRNKRATATDRKVSFSFQSFHYMKQQLLHFLLHFCRRMNMVIQPYKGDNQSFVPGSQRIQQQMLVLPISLTYLTFHQITLYRTFKPLLGHKYENRQRSLYMSARPSTPHSSLSTSPGGGERTAVKRP